MSAPIDLTVSTAIAAKRYFEEMDAAVERTKQNLANLLLAYRVEAASAKMEAHRV